METVADIEDRRAKRNNAFSLDVANLQQKLSRGQGMDELGAKQRAFGVADNEDIQALYNANAARIQAEHDAWNARFFQKNNPGPQMPTSVLPVGSSGEGGKSRSFGMSYDDQAQTRAEQARQRAIVAMANQPNAAAPITAVNSPRGTATQPSSAAQVPLPYTVDGKQAFAAQDGSDPRAGKFQRYLNGKVDYYSAAPATLAQNPAATPVPDGGYAAKMVNDNRESALGRQYRMRQQSAMARQQFPLPRIQTRVFEPPATDQADQ